MWVFTRWGFLSIVQHNAMPGYFQVKARVIDPLENLWPEHEIEIIDWADYRFRITMEKEKAFDILSKEIQDVEKIKDFALNVRKNILEMALSAGASSAHFGGALSITEIISTLFAYQMNIDKNNPSWEDRDRFILSKGHACLAYYAALCEVGYISNNELKTFEQNDTNLLGHPVINRDLGIDFSNGSLGMGLSLGIGVAISSKKKKKNFNA